MTGSPNIAGFVDAQLRLVEYMGTDVEFYFSPSAQVFASGTYIDPETRMPLDPLLAAQSTTTFPTITERAMVIRKAAAAPQGADLERFGINPEGMMWLRLPVGTFDTTILTARYCSVFGETFRVMRRFYDSIAQDEDTCYIQCELVSGINLSELTPIDAIAPQPDPFLQETYDATAGQTSFPVAQPFIPGTTEVYLDGSRMSAGPLYDYVESGQSIQFNFPVSAGQVVAISYWTA